MNRALIGLSFGLAAFLAVPLIAQQQKQIKDPAEYSAYMAAYNAPEGATKAAAMEAFAAQYPNSVVRIDALELAMAGYQQAVSATKGEEQAQKAAKVEEIARRILALMPDNIRALAIVTTLDRAKATAGDKAALKEGCGYAQTGVQQLPNWKPEGMTPADVEKLR